MARNVASIKNRLLNLLDPPFDEGHWPENTYLAIPEHKLLYCPIPKVACTSFKTLCVSLSETKVPLGRGLHRRAHQTYSLSRVRRSQAKRLLHDPQWFRFVFVRDPWDRLVSAFYDKFARAEVLQPFALAVVSDIARHRRAAMHSDREVTFRDFVAHILRSPDAALDEHWKPQYLFLGATDFDFVGHFETLGEDFARIAELCKLPPLSLPLTNSTTHSHEPAEFDPSGLADLSAAKLRQLPALPDYRWFYPPDILDQVTGRYQADVDRFGYVFDAPHAGPGQQSRTLPR